MSSRLAHRAGAFALASLLAFGLAPPAGADVVTDWNQTAIRATEIAGVPVPVQTRVMSLVHGAVFDAVNAIDQKYAVYAVDVRAPTGASAQAAAAAAAHRSSKSSFPCRSRSLMRADVVDRVHRRWRTQDGWCLPSVGR